MKYVLCVAFWPVYWEMKAIFYLKWYSAPLTSNKRHLAVLSLPMLDHSSESVLYRIHQRRTNIEILLEKRGERGGRGIDWPARLKRMLGGAGGGGGGEVPRELPHASTATRSWLHLIQTFHFSTCSTWLLTTVCLGVILLSFFPECLFFFFFFFKRWLG